MAMADDDPTARARARRSLEVHLRRPGRFGMSRQPERSVLVEMQAETEAELASADAALAEAWARRQAAAARLVAIDAVRHGTGRMTGTDGRSVRPYHFKRRHWTDPLDDADARAALRVLDGEELQATLVELIHVVAEPVTGRDLRRLLHALGLTPAGVPSKAIGNALRTPLADGAVVRVGRGTYAPGPSALGPVLTAP